MSASVFVRERWEEEVAVDEVEEKEEEVDAARLRFWGCEAGRECDCECDCEEGAG